MAASSLLEERLLAFVLALLLPLYLALDDGALGDVTRQQAAAAFFWATALAFAFRVLPRAPLTRHARFVVVAGAMVVAWAVLSLLWTESVERTGDEVTRDLGLVALPTVCLLGLNRRTWTAAAAGISVAALAIPALAVVTRLAPDLIQAARLDAAFGGDRLSYPLGYWNALAGWSAMATAMGLAWSAHLKRDWLRALALAAVPVAGLAVYLTYSRGGVLALGVGGLAVIALSSNRMTAVLHALAALGGTLLAVAAVRSAPEVAMATGSGGALRVAGALLLACAAAWGVALWTARNRLDEREPSRRLLKGIALAGVVGVLAATALVVAGGNTESLDSQEPIAQGDPAARLVNLEGTRDELWGSTLAAFADQPLIGLGPGTFDFHWQRGGVEREAVRDAHSLYLETLAERGLPGLIFLSAFLGALLAGALGGRRAVRRSTNVGAATGLAAAFIVFLAHAAVDWMWEVTAVAVLALGAAAIAAAGAAPGRKRVSGSLAVRIGLVTAAVVAGATQVPGLVGEQRLRLSQAAFLGGDDEEASRLASDSVGAEPWAATPYAWRANIELSEGRLVLARRDARAAIKREETNPAHRFLLARIEIERDDQEGALRALRGLSRLSPSSREAVDAATQSLLEPAEAGIEGDPGLDVPRR